MRQLTLIEVSGSPRERGRQHGEAAREQIRRSIAFYSEAFVRTAGLSWDEIQRRAPAWLPSIEQFAPDALEEVRGIAEGANARFEEILALNGRGELSYGNPFDESEDACSSFAMTEEASGDAHVYCGQNWDWRSGVANTIILLRIHQPPKPTIIMQTEAGQIGRQGVNSAGIGLNANGLGGRFGSQTGIPGPYIRRRILDSADMHDALQAVFNSRQAANTNLLFTHRDGFAIDIETTPERHGWMYPTNGLLVHANHFIAFVPPQIENTYRPFSVDSLYRVPRIERVLKTARSANTPTAMRELIGSALTDHFGAPNSVCNHADARQHPFDQTETVASSIVDLTSGEYYVSAGLPCEAGYQKLPWSIYDETTPSLEHRPNGVAVVA
jgi:isopenicillin-N N-acyltransferase-like protein